MTTPLHNHSRTPGTRLGHRSTLRTRRGVALLIGLKLCMIAVLLALPAGLAISLGAAHAIALLLILATGAATLVVHRRRRARGSESELPSPVSMSPDHWEERYTGRPDWDLGRPQPAFRALADEGAIRGRVLDVGCGTGEHVLMCAGLGLDATGVDVAPTALRIAETKRTDRGLTARFLRLDARGLTDLAETFDTVLDCGLFHVFGDEDRAKYLVGVRSVLAIGGRYFMLCFSDRQPGDRGPRRITRSEIVGAFADGWRLDAIDATVLDSEHHPEGIQGWLVAATKQDDPRWTARAEIHTATPGRYLVQLCKHANGMRQRIAHMHRGDGTAHPRVEHLEWTDTDATLTLSIGRCALHADTDSLTVRAEAANEQNLQQIQQLITADLERFGRRHHLTVDWQHPTTEPPQVE